jgi:hypothetical protein
MMMIIITRVRGFFSVLARSVQNARGAKKHCAFRWGHQLFGLVVVQLILGKAWSMAVRFR